ncbi:aspartate/glutamate racemase family protein [Roseateles sp. BYS96W]|uniref:Aspartate/glutamate racemase family protein n=1 Tax=Pelomonas nitida TaxID=3299027 RepID=A0ABW7GD08_9BURK
MKTIGLIGGLSWKATLYYYDYLNELGNRHLGKSHSPHIVVDSLDFERVAQFLRDGDDNALVDYLGHSVQRLLAAGADAVTICCNSAHKVATRLAECTGCALIDIRHEVVADLQSRGICEVLLLGTLFTMEERFYQDVLEAAGIRCRTPDAADRAYINEVIMKQLSVGIVSEESRERFVAIGRKACDSGAQAVLLACTELPLLVGAEHFDVPVVDASLVHARAAFKHAARAGAAK